MHDFQHPGVNNHFLVSTRAPLAQRYNDTHVLENHHLSASFSIMSRPECDLCEGMKREEAAQFRDLMVSLVLVTDMVVHFDFVADVQRRLEASDGCLDEKVRDRRVILRLALKCADISNPAKPVRGAVRWTAAVIGEFFHQGDRERELGLPVSPLCDRTTTNIPKSQARARFHHSWRSQRASLWHPAQRSLQAFAQLFSPLLLLRSTDPPLCSNPRHRCISWS